jgi:hypothetical protein
MPAILGWILVLTVSRILFLLNLWCLPSDFLIRIRVFTVSMPIHWAGWCASSFFPEVIRIASGALITTLLGPIFPIALTLFYYDQRIRQEGFDIERMMEAAGLNIPVTSGDGEGTVASPPAEEGLA